MNTISYYRNGCIFAAVAAEFAETVTFYQYPGSRFASFASIKFEHEPILKIGYYESLESGYALISRETYLHARRQAASATAEFFGEFERYQTPPTALDKSLMQGFLTVVHK